MSEATIFSTTDGAHLQCHFSAMPMLSNAVTGQFRVLFAFGVVESTCIKKRRAC
jgi:hypothetical protein